MLRDELALRAGVEICCVRQMGDDTLSMQSPDYRVE